jgi:pumilio family protein 6
VCCAACCCLLQDKLEELVTNKHAHRVLMQLLCPDSHRYLPPATYELLHPPPKTMMVPAAAKSAAVDDDDEELDAAAAGGDDDDDAAATAAGSEDEDAAAASDGGGDADAAGGQQQDSGSGGGEKAKLVPRQLGESKKAADVRRRELLGSGPGSLSGGLVQLCAEQAPQLLASPVGSEVLVEVARGAGGGLLWQLQQDGVRAVHEALVQHIQQELASGSSSTPAAAAAAKQQQQQQSGKKKGGKAQQAAADAGAGADDADTGVIEPLLTHYYASRALRRLLLAGDSEGDEGAGARALAEELWSQALQGHCGQLVGSHAEKVLAALLHCGVPGVVQAAAAELQPLVGGGDTSAWAAKFVGPAAAGGGGGGGGGKQQQGGKRKQQQQRPAKEQPQQQPKQKRGKKA